MIYTLVLTLIFAALDWLAVGKKWHWLEYIAKPATLATLLAGFAMITELKGIALWFGLGLFLSLAGDVFLMLPREQFIAGLVAFLLAHVAYIVGFNMPLPPLNLFGLALAVLIGILAARVLRPILAGLAAKGQAKLRLPVLVYGVVISVMLLSALLTLFRLDWSPLAALLASLGAALFFLSDVILVWNRFVNPIEHGRVMNIVAYHLGQIMLAAGVILQVTM
ncbi:MAG: lysoplasmalogenase [Chloroflexi bacterium]|nr:lysoplasmalogenase [Chloroflexota bacterium]